MNTSLNRFTGTLPRTGAGKGRGTGVHFSSLASFRPEGAHHPFFFSSSVTPLLYPPSPVSKRSGAPLSLFVFLKHYLLYVCYHRAIIYNVPGGLPTVLPYYRTNIHPASLKGCRICQSDSLCDSSSNLSSCCRARTYA